MDDDTIVRGDDDALPEEDEIVDPLNVKKKPLLDDDLVDSADDIADDELAPDKEDLMDDVEAEDM